MPAVVELRSARRRARARGQTTWSDDVEWLDRMAAVDVATVVDAQVVLPQGDFGQAVADPCRALLAAVAAGMLHGPVFGEVAVVVRFGGEGRPRQLDQQHVIE